MLHRPNKAPTDKRAHGFTLIEIMVVVVIIGIIAAMVVPNVISNVDDAQITRVKSDIRAIDAALQLYKLHNYRYPTTDQGLDALVTKPNRPPVPKNWRNGGYLKAIPKDPWGEPYKYLSPGKHGNYDIFTLGADARKGGSDNNADIGNWDIE